MAEIGGMLAAAVLKGAAGKVAAAAGDRVMLQWRFGEDLKRMQETLKSIEAVLEDAERRSIEEAPVRLWLKRLTAASYNISDMFDEFEVNTTKKSALRKFKVLNRCLTLGPEYCMAGKMKKAREDLEDIKKDHHDFRFTTGSSSYVQQIIDDRATSPDVMKADILGRDREKQRVISRLTTSSEFIILPIYGIGGIGKTTLAQLLFSDAHFKDYEKAWVYVSQIFNLKKIADSIRSQLQKEQNQLTNTQETNDASKKILIVLDDLWENDDFKLDDLTRFLRTVGNGGKMHVIVTTRDANIAQKIVTTEAHKIEPLSYETCWEIIKQIVRFQDRADRKDLEVTGIEIAKKCVGVALAARALGYMLRSRDSDGWVSVKNSGLWNVSRSGDTSSLYDNVLASLKLSYSNMPPYLRLCFAYCAIFPKGHKMAKDELIYQWAALGFIKQSDGASTWQQAENCIKQLLEMSVFEHSESPSSDGQHDKDTTLFTMHDLVHDLARSIMGDEVLDASTKCDTGGSNCRYVFLADCSKPLNLSVIDPHKIRALRFLGSTCECLLSTCECYALEFSTAKYLRVLDLGEYFIQKFPSSIGKLKQLRYLNVPGMKCPIIPSCITKLSKLIYLNLRGSSAVLALPESIGEMEDLMYLDLSGCFQIRKLPESFGKLKNLVHLNLHGSSAILALPESIGEMEGLMYLDLSGCSKIRELPGSFEMLKNLVHVDFSNCSVIGIPEALRSLTTLQYLNLSMRRDSCGFQLQDLRRLAEVIGELTELRYLNLSGCMNRSLLELTADVTSLFGSISTLSNLEHLDLSLNNYFRAIPDSFCSLRKLHTLDLTDCIKLRSVPQEIGDIDSLKFLIVTGCCGLDKSKLPTIKSLISLPNFVVHDAEGGESSRPESSRLVLLKDVTAPELVISRLENVKSIEEAWIIKLGEKQSMKKLTLDWTREKKRFVDDMDLLRELVPPRNLEAFNLRGYNSMGFPTWVMDIVIHLPSLVYVSLEGLSQCSSLPPLGQLPNLKFLHLEAMPNITKIGRAFCGGQKAFARLEHFTISNMESLEEWSSVYSYGENVADEFMFPDLRFLKIDRCDKLRVNPCLPRVNGTWEIKDSDGVLQQWGECSPHTGSSTSSIVVAGLRVRSCMAPMHQWKLLHHLTSLQNLSIHRCQGEALPEWLRNLTSLKTLKIFECPDLKILPESMRHLSSLRSLELIDCQGIQALPEGLGDLVSLKILYIYGCPALSEWLELEENKMKIAHIKEVITL